MAWDFKECGEGTSWGICSWDHKGFDEGYKEFNRRFIRIVLGANNREYGELCLIIEIVCVTSLGRWDRQLPLIA